MQSRRASGSTCSATSPPATTSVWAAGAGSTPGLSTGPKQKYIENNIVRQSEVGSRLRNGDWCRFEGTISGHFHGHTHNDEFAIYYDPANSSRATNVGFISPSVATFTGLHYLDVNVDSFI